MSSHDDNTHEPADQAPRHERSEVIRRFAVAARCLVGGPGLDALLAPSNTIFSAGPALVGDLRRRIEATARNGGRYVIHLEFAPGPADLGPSRFHVGIPNDDKIGPKFVWVNDCVLWCSDARSEVVLTHRTGRFPYMFGSRGGELTFINPPPGSFTAGQVLAMERLKALCGKLADKQLGDTVDPTILG